MRMICLLSYLIIKRLIVTSLIDFPAKIGYDYNMKKLTDAELQVKSQVLLALTSVWEFVEDDIAIEVEGAMTKLALQLARDVNGLTI